MFIKIENSLKKEDPRLAQNAHFIPCDIASNGEANVDIYFEPYIKETDGVLKASFRGHPLIGKKQGLPTGYKVVQLKEAKKPLNENAERKFHVQAGFDEFTLWNWDKIPNANDNMTKALAWTHLAEALHGD